ncbi:MAG: DUF1343 domain-containing protein [Armatimonas sp.]
MPGMVQTGLERLVEADGGELKGRKVGLITNPTGILADGTSGIEALRGVGVKLGALFGPEHGVRGDVPAGKYIPNYTDAKTGLTAYSLYGKTRQPTAAMLRGLDALAFDLQDIGARSYTYLSSLGEVLKASAIHKIPVFVLDRPNPCGGVRVEGGPTRAGFTSFISKYPTAYLHGLTLGEAARLMVGEGWVGKAELTVISCANLTRTMVWPDFERPRWVPTSPNVPKWETALLYAATGIIGELPSVSIGIGVPGSQFALCGAPGIDGQKLAAQLSTIPNWKFTPESWTPAKGVHAGKRCTGVRLTMTDPQKAVLCRLNFALLAALRNLPHFSSGEETRMFDLSCGTDAVRRAYQKGASEADLWAEFQRGVDGFAKKRQKYLLDS